MGGRPAYQPRGDKVYINADDMLAAGGGGA